MKIPKIDWIPFDKKNPPVELIIEEKYLILLREHYYNEDWKYSVDVATPFGSYLDDFWNTEIDWNEGQELEVIAYAELPYCLKEEDLIDDCI